MKKGTVSRAEQDDRTKTKRLTVDFFNEINLLCTGQSSQTISAKCRVIIHRALRLYLFFRKTPPDKQANYLPNVMQFVSRKIQLKSNAYYNKKCNPVLFVEDIFEQLHKKYSGDSRFSIAKFVALVECIVRGKKPELSKQEQYFVGEQCKFAIKAAT